MSRAGYQTGVDIAISLDIAASEFYEDETYHLRLENRKLRADQFGQLIESWIENYPICSIEDPFSEMDFKSWQFFAKRWKDKIQIIGDDLFTTNPVKLKDGIENNLANSVLIKLNQIGTVSETLSVSRWHRMPGGSLLFQQGQVKQKIDLSPILRLLPVQDN